MQITSISYIDSWEQYCCKCLYIVQALTAVLLSPMWGLCSSKLRVCIHQPFPRTLDWLIVCCLTPFSTVFQLYHGGQCTYPWFPGVLLTSTPHNILSKPLTAFLHNHCQSNGLRWERNESCRNDYHQSSERKLAEPGIELATSCSQVRNATDWAVGLDPRTLNCLISKLFVDPKVTHFLGLYSPSILENGLSRVLQIFQ